MKRTEFLRRIIGIPVAAAVVISIPESVSRKPNKSYIDMIEFLDQREILTKMLPTSEPQYLAPFDLLCFYSNNHNIPLGEEVESDMGDKAVVVKKFAFDPNYTQYIISPKIRGKYRWSNLEKFKVMNRIS